MVNKTAIQWLYEQYRKEAIPTDAIVDLFRKAEAMEKRQLCHFYVKGAEAELNNPYVTNIEFYNKTFKSE